MPRARITPAIELEYEVIGSGRPLLLIGGLGAQLISWDDAFCEAVAGRGYRVIRYDNRDSGLSTALEEHGVPDLLGLLLRIRTAPYLLEDMAADAVGLLDHLGLAAVDVIGLSLEGMIAQLMALGWPHRVSSLVAALSGPPGRPSDLPAPDVIDVLLTPPRSTFEERVDAAVELRRVLSGGASDFDAEEARNRATAQIARSYRPAGTMRQAAAVMASPNRMTDLDRIAAPALLIHGELDPLVSFASAKAAAGAMRHAEFVGIPRLGHDLPAAVALELIDRVADFHASISPQAPLTARFDRKARIS